MMVPSKLEEPRRGATTVELAAVLIIFVLFLFGIFEYCMIVYTTNVVENAAREGARFAVVQVNDATIVTDTQNHVKSLMGGIDTRAPYACNVYLANSSGANIGSAAGAKFGQYVCVEVAVTYVPMTPGLGFLQTFTIRSKSSMISEAN